ncbi:hypothetical protein C4577_00870 [Candidatus Parcubacteria bacterium]|nr:MAG: hypothetical protein C4577_00870 [Candidatus Parcubacteria bacterium]
MNKMSYNIKERIIFTAILVLTVLVSYFLPSFEELYFVVIIVLFFFSKIDHFWVVYFFFIMQFPGGLFLPPHGLIRGISISHYFIIATLIKIFIKNEIYSENVIKVFSPVALYSFVLILIGVYNGIDGDATRLIQTSILSLVFIYTVQKMISNKIMFDKLIDLIFLSMIYLFIMQIHDYVSHTNTLNYLGGASDIYNVKTDLSKGQIIRIFYGPLISFFALIFSLNYLLKSRNENYSNNFLLIIVIISYLNIFLTATRGYVLQYTFIILLFSFMTKKRFISLIISLIATYYILIEIFPILNIQIGLVVERLMTLSDFFAGDKTAGGTLIRITERAPRVWAKFLEYPVMGVGYSKIGVLYNDDHVGNYTLLLQGGILGLLVYITCLLTFINLLYKKFKNLPNNMIERKHQIIFFIAIIISLIIAHSTSSTIFTYYFEPHLAVQFSLLFLFYKFEILR